ncbi:small acid-soluble spore protein Tlp [Lederbergia galactosidilytica]|uniref:Small, acid-soluble spore protein Tlp n=1 Tax=Lederbergia galactosidilytica TaxID=217031 RepID=A0A0Q9XN68_9BACI|nr:small acid-soluble spore protein Tlp [Lederbergia galactosidilytica]KRG09702.1 small acid-soluble spore protein Tlp [Lederbergia galactosidilytica]OAK72146.1 small acid-soluble spore protein Tlp [Lederbergia galactosidilytica]
MANDKYQPKPDDRSDNVEKLQEMIHNTIDNMEEAEETMEFSDGEQRENISRKNEKRRQSLEGMREELKDEAAAQENQYE